MKVENIDQFIDDVEVEVVGCPSRDGLKSMNATAKGATCVSMPARRR
jgi:hypothetical protein